MSDSAWLRERLEAILEALERVPRRLARVRSPQDFVASEEGREHLDSICMVLLSVGEAFWHGKQAHIFSLLFHTLLELLDDKYQLLRAHLPTRQTFFDDLRAPYLYFDS